MGMDKIKNVVSNKFDVLWQSALVKLPRAAPLAVLKYTSPLGPHPFILELPSRDYEQTKRTIPVYVFLPPIGEDDPYAPEVNSSATSLESKSSQNSLQSAKSKDSTQSAQSQEYNPRFDPNAPQHRHVGVRNLPVVVDFHGGGFFMGSPLEQAPFCAQLARNLRCVVLSVDYRMGPVDKFPGAIHDAEDVLNLILAPPQRPKMPHSASSYTGTWRSRAAKPPTGPGIVDLQNTISYRINETLFKNRKQGQAPRPIKVKLDRTRVAVCGFSSGGNIALNMGLDIPAGAPGLPDGSPAWPSPFTRYGSQQQQQQQQQPPRPTFPPRAATDTTLLSPDTAAHPHTSTHPTTPQIPLLLFYPSLDLRLLPSERSRPPALGPHPDKGPSWWSRLNDTLAPSYCPREQTSHPRASPGLADPAAALHPSARVLLVLTEKDTLAEQSEAWVHRIADAGRSPHLRVERYAEKHGWTQIPETWLSKEEQRTRVEVFKKTEAFVRAAWGGRDPVAEVQRNDTVIREKAGSGETGCVEREAERRGVPVGVRSQIVV